MQHFQELYWHFPEPSNNTMLGNFPALFKMKEIHQAIFFRHAFPLLPPSHALSAYKAAMFLGNNTNNSCSVEQNLNHQDFRQKCS